MSPPRYYLLLGSCVVTSSLAQTPAFELDETVVTASKLGETESETLRSIGRVDAARIEDNNLRDTADAFRLLGNVIAPQDPDSGLAIRGVNSQNFDANNATGSQVPLITTFVDGVALSPQAARRGPLGLWDVESVEVLRGPQSTLQGKNSLAGTVNIRTKDPTWEFEAATRVTFAEYNTYERAAMLNIPLNDSFFLRLTGEITKGRSPIRFPNLQNSPFIDDIEKARPETFRAKILFEPAGSDLRSLLTYSYSTNSPAVRFAAGPNLGGLGDNAAVTDSFFNRINNLTGGIQTRDAHTHLAGWDNTYQVSDTLRLTSLSTFLRNQLNVPSIPRVDIEEDYTQEFRLNWDDSWGRAVLGLFASHNPVKSTQNDIKQERNNYALFGEADFRTVGDLYLIAGGRLSYDEFSFQDLNAAEDNTNDFEFLPRAGLRHEFTEDHTLGVSISRGYRAGGIGNDSSLGNFSYDPESSWNYELSYRNVYLNDRLQLSANAFFNDWKDRQVTSLTEIGGDIGEVIFNAASSNSCGAEIELTYQANECLELFASVGYLKSEYEDFTIPLNPPAFLPDALLEADFAGYEFAQAPRFNGSIGLTYRPWKGLFVSADASSSSDSYSPYFLSPPGSGTTQLQVPQDDSVEIDSFFKVNLSLGYEWENARIDFFVNNLFNEEHLIGQEPGVTLLPETSFYPGSLGYPAEPRTYGASFEYKF